MLRLRLFITFKIMFHFAFAGTTSPGGHCSTSRNRLGSNTHKFLSDCSDQTYCSGPQNGTCLLRTCRRDEFPFGYGPEDFLPPLCPRGTFCPDEGDACRLQVSVGGACQMDRDEQCAPAANWREISNGENFYGSLCLRGICMFANVTYGEPCVIDKNTYTDIGFDGKAIGIVIVRDNCRAPQSYCNQETQVCERTKTLGDFCQQDQECELRNCVSGVCTEPPETPFRVAPWQYVITAFCVIGAMISICMLLTVIHRRHRMRRYREIREYYFEQLNLRKSIMALHSAAAVSEGREQMLI
ncbi:hypothetical protein K435DRAFT_743840 [Dendrothele bispora CBS 962.96]|uniref:EB domain-containing protein n=1 Tax=Dendrothele bispora (strain CBS 962.96) TaxID=1314807 RepID=A0A4S8MUK5_DENBC|nr:hypothetical protein K435DRAFT_743840 [Dendrothele bispora CBS 962.96]